MTKNNQIIHQLAICIGFYQVDKMKPEDAYKKGKWFATIYGNTRKEFQLVLSFLDEAKQHVAIVPIFSKYRSNGKIRYRYRHEIKLNYQTLVSKKTREGCKGYILRNVFAIQFPELFSRALNAVNNESKKANKETV